MPAFHDMFVLIVRTKTGTGNMDWKGGDVAGPLLDLRMVEEEGEGTDGGQGVSDIECSVKISPQVSDRCRPWLHQ